MSIYGLFVMSRVRPLLISFGFDVGVYVCLVLFMYVVVSFVRYFVRSLFVCSVLCFLCLLVRRVVLDFVRSSMFALFRCVCMSVFVSALLSVACSFSVGSV